jgi:hypothetical protein
VNSEIKKTKKKEAMNVEMLTANATPAYITLTYHLSSSSSSSVSLNYQVVFLSHGTYLGCIAGCYHSVDSASTERNIYQ